MRHGAPTRPRPSTSGGEYSIEIWVHMRARSMSMVFMRLNIERGGKVVVVLDLRSVPSARPSVRSRTPVADHPVVGYATRDGR